MKIAFPAVPPLVKALDRWVEFDQVTETVMPRLARVAPVAARAATWTMAQWIEQQLAAGTIDKNTYYDRLTDLVMARTLTRGAVCVDVGCHTGQILRRMMHYAPEGKFLAFEPIPQMFEQLVKDFAGPRVRVYDFALSDTTGTSSFNFVTSNPGYSGLRRRRYDRPHETEQQIEVRTEQLDSLLAREPVDGRISFVKIDVEGAEYLVLGGARKMLREHRPVIVFEHGLGASDHYGIGPEQVLGLLSECGLRVSLMSDWLRSRPALTPVQFFEQYYQGKNYYYMAHE